MPGGSRLSRMDSKVPLWTPWKIFATWRGGRGIAVIGHAVTLARWIGNGRRPVTRRSGAGMLAPDDADLLAGRPGGHRDPGVWGRHRQCDAWNFPDGPCSPPRPQRTIQVQESISTWGDPMAVLVRMTAAWMDAATYDQISAQLVPVIKKQPGFIVGTHVIPQGL